MVRHRAVDGERKRPALTVVLWALPGVVTVIGVIAIAVVASRLSEEAGLLRLELARVSELRPSARALAAEARALRATEPHGVRR